MGSMSGEHNAPKSLNRARCPIETLAEPLWGCMYVCLHVYTSIKFTSKNLYVCMYECMFICMILLLITPNPQHYGALHSRRPGSSKAPRAQHMPGEVPRNHSCFFEFKDFKDVMKFNKNRTLQKLVKEA